MKRRDLIRHLDRHGCRFLREGGRHSVYQNPLNGRKSAVPRHNDINEITARSICDDLEI